MPQILQCAAVQANYLMAAAAMTDENHPLCGGILLETHPATGAGVLIVAMNGAELGIIYDGHGAIEGEPRSWLVPFKTISTAIGKVLKRASHYQGDVWAVLTRDADDKTILEVVKADDGDAAIKGDSISIIRQELPRGDNTYSKLRPSVFALIEGATSLEKATAPPHWFTPTSLVAINEFASGLAVLSSREQATTILGTRKNSVVQVAFREYEEAMAFVLTLDRAGAMRTDNPGWLDALL